MVTKAGIILTRNFYGNEQIYVVIQRFYPGYNQFLELLNDIINSVGSVNLTHLHKPSLTNFRQSIIDMYGEENINYYDNLIYITDNIIKPFLILLLQNDNDDDHNKLIIDYEICDKKYSFSSVVSLPKGSIDKDELPLNCAIREFKEETELNIDNSRINEDNINADLTNNYIIYYNIRNTDILNPDDIKLCQKYSKPLTSASSGDGTESNTITNFFIRKINDKDHNLFNLDEMLRLKTEYYENENIKRQFEIIDSGFINKNSLPDGSRFASLSPDLKKIIDPKSTLITAKIKYFEEKHRKQNSSKHKSSSKTLSPDWFRKGGRIKNISKKNKKRKNNKSKKNKKV